MLAGRMETEQPVNKMETKPAKLREKLSELCLPIFFTR